MVRTRVCSLFFILVLHSSSKADIVLNGGFESPLVAGTYADSYDAGQAFGSWNVSEGRIGHLTDANAPPASPGIVPYEGNQFVQLAGLGGTNGAIFQELNAIVGQQYLIRFGFSGNPDQNFGPPIVKQLELRWEGSVVDTLSFDTTGNTFEDPAWIGVTYQVTASSSTVRLEFANVSTGANPAGPLIDSVSVTAVPEPTGFVLLNVATSLVLLCRGERRRQRCQMLLRTAN